MKRLRISLPLVVLTIALSGCVSNVEFIPTGEVSVDQDGNVTARGGITVAPVFTGKYK